jgi:hypothetical protein
MRSSVPVLLISCILRVTACSSNRCAVQMIDPRSPLPAHPRAAPGKEKVGGIVEECGVVCGAGASHEIVCCSIRMDMLLGSFFSVLFRSQEAGLLMITQHVLSRGQQMMLLVSFFSTQFPTGNRNCNRNRKPSALPSGVRRMKLKRFRTAPISFY